MLRLILLVALVGAAFGSSLSKLTNDLDAGHEEDAAILAGAKLTAGEESDLEHHHHHHTTRRHHWTTRGSRTTDNDWTTRGQETTSARETTSAAATTESPDSTTSSSTACTLEVNKNMPTNQPLILYEDKLAIRNPDSGDKLYLSAGEKLRLYCAGTGNYLEATNEQEGIVECVSGTTFTLSGESYDFSSLSCMEVAQNSAKSNGTCLDGSYTKVALGFEVGDDFLTLMENCLDETNANSIYSRHTLSKHINGYESGYARPSFSQSTGFYSFDVNEQYYRSTQRKTIGELLGSTELGYEYIQSSGYYYLARGHLTPKVDFVYGALQRCTFYYMNCAPQWQTFNGENWNYLEGDVRSYASSGTVDLDVITGTLGVATLPNTENVETELYLYVSGSSDELRVPKYYWKLVRNPEENKATVFVGINNPYHTVTDDDIFCSTSCSAYSWLSMDLTSQANGYIFCCSVEEFLKVASAYVPSDISSSMALLD